MKHRIAIVFTLLAITALAGHPAISRPANIIPAESNHAASQPLGFALTRRTPDAVSRDFLRAPIATVSPDSAAENMPANIPATVDPPANRYAIRVTSAASPSGSLTAAVTPSVRPGAGRQTSRPSAGRSIAANPVAVDAYHAYAAGLLDATQFVCVDNIWTRESHWHPLDKNPTSSAFGIAQMLTEKSTDAFVQIRDGLAYIARRYGSPCAAWAFWKIHHWY